MVDSIHKMAEVDRHHIAADGDVVRIRQAEQVLGAEVVAAGGDRDAERFADAAVVEKFLDGMAGWCCSALEANDRFQALLLRKCGKLFGLSQVLAKRPFAVHGFSLRLLQYRLENRVVPVHPNGADDQVDVGVFGKLLSGPISLRAGRQAVSRDSSLRGVLRAIEERYDLVFARWSSEVW